MRLAVKRSQIGGERVDEFLRLACDELGVDLQTLQVVGKVSDA